MGLAVKPPYLRKLAPEDGYAVWLVDGRWIRANRDIEFTNFDQHLHKKYIPAKEIWLDSAVKPSERQFFIDSAIRENKSMAHGESYDKADTAADSAERKARKSDPERTSPVKKSLLGKIGKVSVYLVNGESVRDKHFVDFNQGGHGRVYRWIPKFDIWLADDVAESERKFDLLHELYEWNLMGAGEPYEKAHHASSMIELRARRNPKIYGRLMQPEIAKAGGKGRITWLKHTQGLKPSRNPSPRNTG